MRKHRMFHVGMITDDQFDAMTCKAQLLYLKLIAIADDDGFVGNVKMLSPRKNHLNELVSAGLLHIFDSGHVLILHWFCHNSVKNSHKKETLYRDEKALVLLDEQGVYRLKDRAENSGNFPPKEKKIKEKKIKENEEKEREEKEIKAKEEEISAMHELLDCAAANLILTVKEKTVKISKKEVSEALGKFNLRAKDDGNGNYILEIVEE